NSSNELTSDSNASYAYDTNGNTTSKTASSNTTDYAWDYENRLTSVTLPNSGGTVTFKYDPFGRRIQKISPTTTSIFAYDRDNLVETVNASGGVVARYAQAPGTDQPLAMERGTTTSFYEQDGLGSVTSLTNAAGTLAQSYTYDSFGNTTNSSGSLTNFFRYTGREFDTETNLYYNRARYLDPSTGRFLSEDPLRFWVASSFYPYAYNQPTMFVDPLGTNPQPGDSWTNHIPGVLWLKCKIWGYYCLQVVFQKKQEELANPSPYSTDDLTNGTGDEGQRQIRICVAGDDNCKKFIAQCGGDVLGPIKTGMFPH
ncbi:MAG: RHS repeat-associated core domain-containing protein, partial [Candidatus Acidiferrales bacterium]